MQCCSWPLQSYSIDELWTSNISSLTPRAASPLPSSEAWSYSCSDWSHRGKLKGWQVSSSISRLVKHSGREKDTAGQASGPSQLTFSQGSSVCCAIARGWEGRKEGGVLGWRWYVGNRRGKAGGSQCSKSRVFWGILASFFLLAIHRSGHFTLLKTDF